MKKFFLLTIILSFFALLFAFNPEHTKAGTLVPLTDLDIDTTITRQDDNFNLPRRIVIVPLTPPSNDLDTNDTEWFRGIYYYTIDYLGFSDVPFHYFVTKTGEILEGNSGGDERKISIKGVGDDVILIAYLSDKFANTFDPRAEESLKDLTTEVANRNSISSDKILVSGIKFVKDPTTRTVIIDQDKVFGNWETDVNKIKTHVSANYNPVPKEYTLSIVEVTVEKSEIQAGDVVNGQIKLRNNGNYGIYFGSQNEVTASKADGASSRFYVNGQWLSQTQFSIMNEGAILAPGDEKSYTFKLRAPLFTGENIETFELKTVAGKKINSDTFALSMNIVAGDKRIVEIAPRSGSYVPIRRDANNSAGEILRGYPGDRFFFMQDIGNGWVQLDIGNGQSGWVASWNIKFI